MRRYALGFAVLALVWASPADAQLRSYSLGVSGGLSMPLSDMGKAANPGFNVAGHFKLRPGSFTNLSFRGDLSYDRWGVKDEALLAGASSATARVIGISVSAVYELPSAGMTNPYILGGVGNFGRKFSYQFPNGASNRDDSAIGIQGGFGLGFSLSGFSTFLEARFVNLMTDPTSTQYLPVVFGIEF